MKCTAYKVSKYGVNSDPYFPIFSPNTEKYRPKKTPYLDTFHAVWNLLDTKILRVCFLCFQLGLGVKLYSEPGKHVRYSVLRKYSTVFSC